jgi:hypothetical protein
MLESQGRGSISVGRNWMINPYGVMSNRDRGRGWRLLAHGSASCDQPNVYLLSCSNQQPGSLKRKDRRSTQRPGKTIEHQIHTRWWNCSVNSIKKYLYCTLILHTSWNYKFIQISIVESKLYTKLKHLFWLIYQIWIMSLILAFVSVTIFEMSGPMRSVHRVLHVYSNETQQ